MDDTNMSFLNGAVTATPRTPETHAYYIPHVDVTNLQIRKSIVATVDNASARDDTLITANERSIFTIDAKRDSSNFGSSYDPRKILSDVRDEESDDQQKVENYNRQQTTIGNNESTIQTLSNINHVYEEIKAIKEPRGNSYEYNIRDNYEKCSPVTAKSSIETLSLPQHAICRKYARIKGSPVYTDRLIYTKESLFAVEVILCQRDDVSCFRYSCENSEDIIHSQYNQSRDCMLVYSYAKTNAAGILYSQCWPRDVFDLQSLLKPSIHVVNCARCNLVVNTQLYHRYTNSYHMRTSKAGCAPMTFYCTRYISDSQNSLIYQKRRLKDSYIGEQQGNRSSLLLLEPLLMPESTDSGYRKDKNRMSQLEHTKVIRIIMAYALSFLILASITFYIVYFT